MTYFKKESPVFYFTGTTLVIDLYAFKNLSFIIEQTGGFEMDPPVPQSVFTLH
ncbi:transmembrane protein, putative [Medicago truncatula]|uniref:Transmembrane protein, putative n=1 Tax=Medicago truncatula TaxID=3880 RepID=A0A072W2P0_MEDTR|nr:transmembrane protein, putative [Medicago truncatula]